VAKCRGCGKEILWGVIKDERGVRNVPLDPTPPTYRVVREIIDPGQPAGCVVERAENVFVTHFATCPNANDFSRKNINHSAEADNSRS
jgi:hypothetical protein